MSHLPREITRRSHGDHTEIRDEIRASSGRRSARGRGGDYDELGAEITAADGSPLDLAATWDDELYEEINHSLLEYKVLIFKNQTALAPETQLAMAQKWGPVPGHPLGSRQDDAISADVPVVVLENTKGRPQEARNDMYYTSRLDC